MNETLLTTARTIVADTLLLRGPTEDGKPFRMAAVDPETLLGPTRLRLVRRYAHMVPQATTPENAERVAVAIAAVLPPTATAGEQRPQLSTAAPYAPDATS